MARILRILLENKPPSADTRACTWPHLLTFGGLLSGLLVVAVVQRRDGEVAVTAPGIYITEAEPAFNVPTAPRTPVPMSIGKIAVGVWLGMRLFVFTAAIPATVIVQHWMDSGQ